MAGMQPICPVCALAHARGPCPSPHVSPPSYVVTTYDEREQGRRLREALAALVWYCLADLDGALFSGYRAAINAGLAALNPRPPDLPPPSGVPPESRNYVQGECVQAGDLMLDDIQDLEGKPCIVVTTERDRLREGPPLVYEQVMVMPLPAGPTAAERYREAIADAALVLSGPSESFLFSDLITCQDAIEGAAGILRRALEVRP